MFSTVSVRRTTFRLSNRDEVRDVVAHRTPNRLYGVCILNFSILKSKMAADPIITSSHSMKDGSGGLYKSGVLVSRNEERERALSESASL